MYLAIMSPLGTMFVHEGAERRMSWRQGVRAEVIAASVGIRVQRYPMFARFVTVVGVAHEGRRQSAIYRHPYIHLDRLEVRVQQRHVMNVTEPIRYRGAVTSANREGSQQRCETVTHYARLHDVRVDVDGIEPLIHLHHVFGHV